MMRFAEISLLSVLFGTMILPALSARADSIPIYQNAKAPLERRVDDLMRRMTQEEELSLLTGAGFSTNPIPRQGIPEMQMADADQGVRGGCLKSTNGPATLFPCPLTQASTWDAPPARRLMSSTTRRPTERS